MFICLSYGALCVLDCTFLRVLFFYYNINYTSLLWLDTYDEPVAFLSAHCLAFLNHGYTAIFLFICSLCTTTTGWQLVPN